jgi:hypothetical protein
MVILSNGHFVKWSFCQMVILSNGHFVKQSFCQHVSVIYAECHLC